MIIISKPTHLCIARMDSDSSSSQPQMWKIMLWKTWCVVYTMLPEAPDCPMFPKTNSQCAPTTWMCTRVQKKPMVHRSFRSKVRRRTRHVYNHTSIGLWNALNVKDEICYGCEREDTGASSSSNQHIVLYAPSIIRVYLRKHV